MAEYEVELPVRVRLRASSAVVAHAAAVALVSVIGDDTETDEVAMFLPDHEKAYAPSRVRETLASRRARAEAKEKL